MYLYHWNCMYTLYEECSAQTIYSFAGIGLCRGPKEDILRNILSHEECVRRLRETEVLLIDEISMLSKRTFEIIQYVSQNVRNSDLAFSGIQIRFHYQITTFSVAFFSYSTSCCKFFRQWKLCLSKCHVD